MHVDYWNYLGWKDEFSSPLFSQRQELYARKFKLDSTYTPQMIVDGGDQFTGSDGGKATNSILSAAKNAKAKIELTNSAAAEGKIKISVSEMPKHETTTVFLAIAEDNLVSSIRRGENSGKTLEHVSVVRELKSVGVVEAQDKAFETEVAYQIQPGWKKENLKLIVFVQGNESRSVYGAKRIQIKRAANSE